MSLFRGPPPCPPSSCKKSPPCCGIGLLSSPLVVLSTAAQAFACCVPVLCPVILVILFFLCNGEHSRATSGPTDTTLGPFVTVVHGPARSPRGRGGGGVFIVLMSWSHSLLWFGTTAPCVLPVGGLVHISHPVNRSDVSYKYNLCQTAAVADSRNRFLCGFLQ